MLLLAAAGPVYAMPSTALTGAKPAVNRDTYGEVGILEMPSARMAPDGEFGISYSRVNGVQHYTFAFQALPWLDTSFRYSRVTQGYYDRSFGVKARVLREQGWLPEVSIGLRDLLGTGVYGGEYITANKRIGDFDLSGGIGWGRFSESETLPNPFGLVSSFKDRVHPNLIGQGTVNFRTFFHGPKAGLFGGIIWQTPIEGLKVLAEYSSDRYKFEQSEGRIMSGHVALSPRSPLNVGLAYDVADYFSVSAGWYYGTTYGLTVAFHGDGKSTYPSALRIGPEIPDPVVRTDAQQQAALKVLQSDTSRRENAKRGGLWVDMPSPAQRARQEVLAALYSQASGVRNIEMQGQVLMVDARRADDPVKQCAQYAQVASAGRDSFHTIALMDLEDSRGTVTFCRQSRSEVPSVSGYPLLAAATAVTGRQSSAELREKLIAALVAQDITFAGLSLNESELWLYYENYRYLKADQAAGRVIRILMANAPPNVDIFHLVPSYLGVPEQEITVSRSGIERTIAQGDTIHHFQDVIALSPPPMSNPALDEEAKKRFPIAAFSLDPKFTQRLFDPDKPIQFMVYADLAAMLQIMPGLSLQTELTGTIWDDYTLTRDPQSVLPHVRSDVLQYLKHGKYGISTLQIDYRGRLAPDVFTEVRAGYLEDMFMGVGGQILWRPENSRLAFGVDAYQVWQRDYNRLFGARNYNVLTGHVSIYYNSPWYDLNYAVHVGRYLARDYGATFEITRRFSTGIEIGAWATFTNVPFSKFGEGSFDKGIIIHIPFEWGLPVFSQSAYDLHLASLTRDGGQRLSGDDSLYTTTRSTSYGDLSEHPDAFLNP